MLRRNLLFATVVFGLLAGAVFLAEGLDRGSPVSVTLVQVEAADDAGLKVVTVAFENRGSNWVRLENDLRVQLRVSQRWLPAEKYPGVAEAISLQPAKPQAVQFRLPRDAEACRVLLDYRIGGSPYCRALAFLSRHGIKSRLPNLSGWALKLVPHRPRLRHAAPELDLMV
jgi:hypothetical protein